MKREWVVEWFGPRSNDWQIDYYPFENRDFAPQHWWLADALKRMRDESLRYPKTTFRVRNVRTGQVVVAR